MILGRQLEPETSGKAEIWAAVDQLIGRAAGPLDLQSHGLGLLAARHWRAQGTPVPDELLEEEQRARLTALLAPVVLERVLAACDGPVLVIKGPAVAAFYPDATLRGFSDIDLLVEDAFEVRQALLRAGAKSVGDPERYADIHHLRPVMWSDLPLPVEVHSSPKWLDSFTPPSVAELLALAQRDTANLRTALAPRPAAHALLLAAHSWAHEPLRRVGDLVDIAAVSHGVPRAEIDRLAATWGIARVWSTTMSTIDALLASGRKPLALRLWAQNVSKVRERTVLEDHLQRCLSSFWAVPPTQAALRLAPSLIGEIRRDRSERWQDKLGRSMRAVANARLRTSEHHSELERQRRRRGKA